MINRYFPTLRRLTDRLAGWRSGHMADLVGNVIYRREIGMTSAGHLRRGSSILLAHGLMLAVLLLNVALFPFFGWPAAFWITLLVALGLIFASWPAAFFQARNSVERERRAGTLEHIYLTPLSHWELFDGKFYGALAPWLEARRYLMLLGILFCFAVAKIYPGPWWLLAAALWLTAVNQFGFGAIVGILAGLKKGMGGPASTYNPFTDWRLNPFLYHLLLILQVGVIVGIPIGVLAWYSPESLRFQYPAFALTLFIPFYASLHLRNWEQAERDRLASDFRSVFSFESTN